MIALPALALPFVIRAAVVEGVATATEVSTIGIVYAVLVGLLIYRQFDWRRLCRCWSRPRALSGAILLIIGAATGMAWALTQSGFSRDARRGHDRDCRAARRPSSRCRSSPSSCSAACWRAFRRSCCSGRCCFRSPRPVGVHEVHYAMVVILAMGIGLFAPPFGVGYYAACAIGRVDPDEGMRPIWGYMLALLVGIDHRRACRGSRSVSCKPHGVTGGVDE